METWTKFLWLVPVLMVGCSGTRPSNLGVNEGRLAPCPNSPNCVSTQSTDAKHGIDPIAVHHIHGGGQGPPGKDRPCHASHEGRPPGRGLHAPGVQLPALPVRGRRGILVRRRKQGHSLPVRIAEGILGPWCQPEAGGANPRAIQRNRAGRLMRGRDPAEEVPG